MFYDLIIIGGGPAGAGAAVYASRKKLKTLLIAAEWGGQSAVSEKIYNWIGTPWLSGRELAENFKKHVLANSGIGQTLEVKEGEKVISIQELQNSSPAQFLRNIAQADGPSIAIRQQADMRVEQKLAPRKSFVIHTESGEEFSAQTILIASGSGHRKLEAKNADKLEHKGLTYCASCDGPLFADMDVAVIGGGNAGFESAAQLLAYCQSVTLLHRSDKFRADEITVERVLQNPKMKAVKNVEILEVQGEKFVQGIVYKDKISGLKTELKVSGIFVEIGQIPNTDFAKDLVPLDEIGRIKINPLNQKTEVPGIWAAGDCANVLYHQNNIAAGDAVRALEDIYLYLHAGKS